MKQYTHDLQSYPNFEKREITKSYSGLERDNSKPRRGSFLNYFWTSSIHAVCFCNCYFNFNLRNPRKAYTVSEPQEEKQSKNLTSCGPALMADLDLEKQHGKVIQRWAGGNNKPGFYLGYLRGRSFPPKCQASPPKILLSLQYISNYIQKIIKTWRGRG